MTTDERERLRGLLREATPGEWWWATANSLRELKAGPAYDARTVAFAYDSASDGVPDISIAEHDMALIAAARTALPALLDELEAAEKDRDEWQAERDRAVNAVLDERQTRKDVEACLSAAEARARAMEQALRNTACRRNGAQLCWCDDAELTANGIPDDGKTMPASHHGYCEAARAALSSPVVTGDGVPR